MRLVHKFLCTAVTPNFTSRFFFSAHGDAALVLSPGLHGRSGPLYEPQTRDLAKEEKAGKSTHNFAQRRE